MTDSNQNPDYGPNGYRELTWQDRLLLAVASALSISPSLELYINEVVLGWLREISQGHEVTAISFADGPGERYIFPRVADPENKNLATLKFSSSGTNARAGGKLGFDTDSLPLLAEGTLRLSARPHQLPDGRMCVAVDIKEPTLARAAKAAKENAVTRARRAKRKAREAKKQQAKANTQGTQSAPPNNSTAQSAPPNTAGTQSAPPNSADTQSAPPTTNSAQSAPSHQTGTDPKPQ